MTNEIDLFQSACSCQGKGGDDLIPLLVVGAILAGVYVGGKLVKRLKGIAKMENNSDKEDKDAACGCGGGRYCSGRGKWKELGIEFQRSEVSDQNTEGRMQD